MISGHLKAEKGRSQVKFSTDKNQHSDREMIFIICQAFVPDSLNPTACSLIAGFGCLLKAIVSPPLSVGNARYFWNWIPKSFFFGRLIGAKSFIMETNKHRHQREPTA
jgi:hypothetical protein